MSQGCGVPACLPWYQACGSTREARAPQEGWCVFQKDASYGFLHVTLQKSLLIAVSLVEIHITYLLILHRSATVSMLRSHRCFSRLCPMPSVSDTVETCLWATFKGFRNESVSMRSVYSCLLVCVCVPLLCQIDHMVQSHPAFTQLQDQARQRPVDPFILLKQFLAHFSPVDLCNDHVQ